MCELNAHVYIIVRFATAHNQLECSSCSYYITEKLISEKKTILTILILLPIAVGGKLTLNLALTDPEHPCGRVTLPQMALTFVFLFDLPGTGVLFLAYITKISSYYNYICTCNSQRCL